MFDLSRTEDDWFFEILVGDGCRDIYFSLHDDDIDKLDWLTSYLGITDEEVIHSAIEFLYDLYRFVDENTEAFSETDEESADIESSACPVTKVDAIRIAIRAYYELFKQQLEE